MWYWTLLEKAKYSEIPDLCGKWLFFRKIDGKTFLLDPVENGVVTAVKCYEWCEAGLCKFESWTSNKVQES